MAISDYSDDSDSDSPTPKRSRSDPHKGYLPRQAKSLARIAAGCFCLGISFALSILVLVLVRVQYPGSPHWRLAFYWVTLSTYHFLEFWTTARFDATRATARSFFPTTNWLGWIFVHTFAFAECLVYRVLYWHSGIQLFRGPPISVVLGLTLVIGGQLVYVIATARDGQFSSRDLKDPKREKPGIFGLLRHPAYLGFFWWAVGTQLVLGNTFSLLGCAVFLWSYLAGKAEIENDSNYVEHKKKAVVGF